MSQFKTAKIDLDQISHVIQSELHDVGKESKDDEVFNRFREDVKKYTLDIKVLERMKASSSTEQYGAVYNINSKMDYIIYLYEKFNLPSVKVEDEYKDRIQIAWTHHLIHHMNVGIYLSIDDENQLTIDSNWFDINSQYFINHIVKNYCGTAGIIPELEDFSTILYGRPIGVTIPFEFSNNLVHSLPLYKLVNTIQFKFEFQLKICKLLRMRELVDGKWTNIEVDPKYLAKMDALSEVSKPEIFAQYALQNRKIRDYYYENDSKREIYLLDVVTVSSVNDIEFGKSIEIDLQCPNPCRGVFVTAQNIVARDMNYYANYTTNANDHTLGDNPIKSFSISYGSIERVKLDNLDIDMLTLNDMPNDPVDVGYIAYSNSFDILGTEHDTSIIYLQNNARIKLKLRDRKPHEPDTKFDIKIKLLVVKPFDHDHRNDTLNSRDWYSDHTF
uniref:Major capsid protein n=1 Tax=Pithovirus LCPAC406 TaxID=2506599 RepID=A0A481ZDC1_9VIRU|nr:MAG: major capsid protein [Pithovirus LCPAC406]